MHDTNQLLKPHLGIEVWSIFQLLILLFIVFLIGRYMYKRYKLSRSKNLNSQ